jgi:cytoskeletal protein CcmA (bactofilin family)
MVWNKKEEELARSRPQAAVAEPALPRAVSAAAPAPAPVAAPPPVQPFRPESPRAAAVLGRGVIVKGQIFSQEDLTIDGDMEGSIEVSDHRLTVGPNGKVQVDQVKAREVVVLGSLKGSVDASDKVFIKKDAELVGDVQTAGIVIEDGAYFKGGIDIRKPK